MSELTAKSLRGPVWLSFSRKLPIHTIQQTRIRGVLAATFRSDCHSEPAELHVAERLFDLATMS